MNSKHRRWPLVLSVLITLIATLALVGCGASGEGGSGGGLFAPAEPEPTPLEVGQTVSVEGVGEFTYEGAVLEDEFNWGIYGYDAEGPTDFLEFFWHVKNDSADEQILNEMMPMSLDIGGEEPLTSDIYCLKEASVSSPFDQPIGGYIEDEAAIVFRIPTALADDLSSIKATVKLGDTTYEVPTASIQNGSEFQEVTSKVGDSFGANLLSFENELSSATIFWSVSPEQYVEPVTTSAAQHKDACDGYLASLDGLQAPDVYSQSFEAMKSVITTYRDYYAAFVAGSNVNDIDATSIAWDAANNDLATKYDQIRQELETVDETMGYLDRTEWSEINYRYDVD